MRPADTPARCRRSHDVTRRTTAPCLRKPLPGRTGPFAHRAVIIAIILAVVPGGCGYVAFEIAGIVSEHVIIVTLRAPQDDSSCTPVPNRCGPIGLLGVLVPDCPMPGACFDRACNAHDLCYGTCGADRTGCDDRFFTDLVSACTPQLAAGADDYLECLALAWVYWQTVVRLGDAAFDITQERICACVQQKSRPGPPSFVSAGGARPTALSLSVPVPFAVSVALERIPLPPFDDYDDDLLPDAWEAAVGLDESDPADAWLDPDNDGLRNLEEFLHGTHPFMPDPLPDPRF